MLGSRLFGQLPNSPINASETGPIFPSAVLSNVEQYFKKVLFCTCLLSTISSADNDSSTSFRCGYRSCFQCYHLYVCSVLWLCPSGTPIRSETFTPDLASILAKSVAPVKSSAIHPKNVAIAIQISV